MGQIIYNEQNDPFKTSFPEPKLSDEERFLYHPEFDSVCQRICSHGHSKLTPNQARAIWVLYIDGKSNRVIAGHLGINDTLVWRTIHKLGSYMALMDLEENEEAQPLSKVVLRQFNPRDDRAFIYASWRNALWYDDKEFNDREWGADRFFQQATQAIRTILEGTNVHVRIACLDNNASHIIGYSVVTGACLQFVYVKVDYRGKRIGTLLVPKSVETVSPVMTKIGRAIAIKKKFIKENINAERATQEECDS